MFKARVLTRMLWQQHNQIRIDYAKPVVNNLYVKYCNVRTQGTVTVNEDGYVKKFMRAVGWMDHSRTKLKLTGFFLYESVPNKVKYTEWFRKLDLPDTFASWFIVTELHVWMLLVRYMAEDISTVSEKNKYVKGDGHFIRNCIIEALWSDVGNRIKLLEGANPAIARKQVAEISEQYQAALVAYDEGLSDDRVLASAIWRRFFELSEVEADKIESIVHFIRHQLSELDKMQTKELTWKPEIRWLSIVDH